MFKLVFATVALLTGFAVAAQDLSISGIVREKSTGKVLPGATVALKGTSHGAQSNEDGKFSFSQLSAGTYTISVKYIGFTSYEETLRLTENKLIEITLEESFLMTDEVIVYSTRANTETPTTYTNIDQETISKQNLGQDLPFLLNWTPSLVTTSDAGAGIGYTGLRIRGSDASRVNVTINGIPYNDSESQGTFWVNISDIASSTQSIQIQRGVGTSTNGAGAFGASVNLQTTSPNSSPYAEVTAGGGSFNTQRYMLKAGTGLINGHWSFDGRVSKINSDGYIKRAESDLGSYYLSGGYYGEKTIVKALMFGGREKTYQAWYGVDEATMKDDRRFNWAGAIFNEDGSIRYYGNETDNYRQDHYQIHIAQRITSSWTANVAFHYTYGRGYYEQFKQAEDFASLGLDDVVIGGTTITAGDFILRKWLDNQFYGTTFSLTHDHDRYTFVFGGGYNEYAKAKHFGEIIWAQYASNSNIRDNYYEGESQKNDFNVYAKLNYAITDQLNGFVDLQLRTVNYETKGTNDDLNSYNITDDLSFFNPKAGITYSISENNTVYASYAVAHREPNRTDYLDGNVKPKAETLGNFEAGWRKAFERFSFEANYYLMNYTDQLVFTGKLNNVGSPIRANVGKSYRSGIELSGNIMLANTLRWNLNATVSQNKNKNFVFVDGDGDSQKKSTSIVLSPDLVAGSQFTWSGLKNLQASLLTKYVGKQYLDNTENDDLAIDPYFVNDLRFIYSIPVKSTNGIDLSLLINNVFDVAYSSNGYSYDNAAYYYPQAGTNFLATVTAKF